MNLRTVKKFLEEQLYNREAVKIRSNTYYTPDKELSISNADIAMGTYDFDLYYTDNTFYERGSTRERKNLFTGTYIDLMNHLGLTKEDIKEEYILVPNEYKNAFQVSNYIISQVNPEDSDKEVLLVGDLSFFEEDVYQVFYHSHCNDGMGAAVEYYNTYKAKSYFRAIAYGTKIDKIKMNDDVTKALFLDFCPSKELVEFLLNEKKLKTIFILDHHKTALETIKSYGELLDTGKIKYFVQQDQSGAMLSFNVDYDKFLTSDIIELKEDDNLSTNMDYSFKEETCYCDSYYDTKTMSGKLRPSVVYNFYNLLDIRDRWVIDDVKEKERADALAFYLTAKEWYGLRVSEAAGLVIELTKASLEAYIDTGYVLEEFNDIMSKDAIKGALKLRLETHNGINLNVAFSYTTIKISNAGFLWTLDNPGEKSLFVGVHINRNDTVSLSMRSDSTYSARAVAERLVEKGICYTGGGHDQAAGATMKYPEDGLKLDWLQDQVINTIIELEVEQESKEEE